MNSDLSEQLRDFQLPPVTAFPRDGWLVVRLVGVDFDSIFALPDSPFENILDARFGKAMVCTTSHLLGGDACGRYGYTELNELSVLLDGEQAASRFDDVTDLQNYLVAMASAKMTEQLGVATLYLCRLYGFPADDLVLAYFGWRQQEAYLIALDCYCGSVLAQDGETSPDQIAPLLADLGSSEKEEILRQHQIDFSAVPTWQRHGTGALLQGEQVALETNLPRGDAYGAFLARHIR